MSKPLTRREDGSTNRERGPRRRAVDWLLPCLDRNRRKAVDGEDREEVGRRVGLRPRTTLYGGSHTPVQKGVAKGERQRSFPNQLVSFPKGGIVTPMEIVVTCAAGSVTDPDRGSVSAPVCAEGPSCCSRQGRAGCGCRAVRCCGATPTLVFHRRDSGAAGR